MVATASVNVGFKDSYMASDAHFRQEQVLVRFEGQLPETPGLEGPFYVAQAPCTVRKIYAGFNVIPDGTTKGEIEVNKVPLITSAPGTAVALMAANLDFDTITDWTNRMMVEQTLHATAANLDMIAGDGMELIEAVTVVDGAAEGFGLIVVLRGLDPEEV